MKIKDLLIWIGSILIAIWLVGIFLKIAGWLLHSAVIVGGVLVIAWILVRFFDSRRSKS